MAKEIELKLFFPPGDLSSIQHHPRVSGGLLQGPAESLETTYFDTPDLTLQRAGITLRRRDTPTGPLQTVKCTAQSVGGLSTRPEWEQAFSGQFDFSAVDATAVRERLDIEAPRLLPLFSTVFRRETRLIAPRPGVRILLMLDSGHLVSAAESAPISELELELVEGTPLDLQDFAIELAAELPLVPFDDSKAARGYRLFRKEPLRPTKAPRSPLTSSHTPEQAFCALAIQGLQGAQANLHGAMNAANPEFVHQFRVALRRMNTLMLAFKPALPEAFRDYWPKALKDLASATGDVRDLDVMRETILLPMQEPAAPPARAELLQRALEACEQARKSADVAIAQVSNGARLLALARDLLQLPGTGQEKPIAEFAEKRLDKIRARAVNRLSEATRQATPENAHRLRIALKHLRYACDFFSPLFDETDMQNYCKAIAALQDELGFVNDFHVALVKLQSWASRDPGLRAVPDYVAQWHGDDVAGKLRKALESGEALLGSCPPWCNECRRRGRARGVRTTGDAPRAAAPSQVQ